MAFELFDRQAAREQKLELTITKHGQMYLNCGARKRLGSPDFIDIYWDKQSQRCGIKSTSTQTANSYSIVCHKEGATFGPTGFLKHISYETGAAWKFPLEWDEAEQMLVFTIPVARLTLTEKARPAKQGVAKAGREAQKVGKSNGVDSTQAEHGGQSL